MFCVCISLFELLTAVVRYVVLWIPILVESKPEIINDKPKQAELLDVPGMSLCILRAEADKSTKDFKLYYRLGKSAPENVLRFSHIESTTSGFVIYRCDFDDKVDALTECLKTSVHHSVYHYIKNLFHVHSFHDLECDSLLRGFCSETVLKWGDNGVPKKVFSHYIKEYVDKLDNSYQTLSGQLAFLQNVVNKRKAYKYGVNRSQQLKRDCFRVMGEASYAGALLRMSRFTVKSKVYSRLSEILIRLEILREQCADSYNTLNNIYNNRLGRLGIVCGVAGILLTAVLEVVHMCSDDYEKVIEHQDSVFNRIILLQDDKLKVMNDRSDSPNAENEYLLNEIRSIK